MRIAIETTLAQGDQTGLGRYVRHLLEGLAAAGPQHQYLLLHATRRWTGPDPGPNFTPVSYFCGKQSLAIALRLGPLLDRLGVDLFHVTCTTGAPPRSRAPVLATVHDLYPLLKFHDCRRLQCICFRLLWHWTRRRACHFITNSRFTADEINRLAGIPRQQITPILLAPSPEHVHVLPLPEPRCIFCLGAIEPRKGQLFLAHVYRELLARGETVPDLVFAGPDRGDGRALAHMLEQPPLRGRARWLGFIDEPTRDRLYSETFVFVFPSFYEGFGLPVLEAMARGVPVLCADIPPLREVAGEAAFRCEPGNAQAWASALLTLVRQPELRSQLVAAGRRQVQRFSWEACARQTIACYEAVAAGRQPAAAP
jgi:glycosyltransferase involved in cell wall biosynthesis